MGKRLWQAPVHVNWNIPSSLAKERTFACPFRLQIWRGNERNRDAKGNGYPRRAKSEVIGELESGLAEETVNYLSSSVIVAALVVGISSSVRALSGAQPFARAAHFSVVS